MYMKYPNMLQATVLWRICALTNINFVNMGSFENIKDTAPFRGVCLFLVNFFKNVIGEPSSNPKINPTLPEDYSVLAQLVYVSLSAD